MKQLLMLAAALAIWPIAAHAQWAEYDLYTFNSTSGDYPPNNSSLTLGSDFNVYGVNFQGGSGGNVTFYKAVISGTSATVTVLHNFTSGAGDGAHPAGSVVQDTLGNFYGITTFGGSRPGSGV